MKKVLVAHATFAGSTPEVAQAIAEVLEDNGLSAHVRPLHQVSSIEGYDGVIIGAPMILGWHRRARSFLRKHRKALQRIPFAVFVTAMSLTQTGDTELGEVPLHIDPKLPKPPARVGKLTLRERYATVANYGWPIVRAVRPARPVSLAFFAGRLDYGRLKWWAVLFAMVLVRAQAGDRRDWDDIRAWALGVAGELTAAKSA